MNPILKLADKFDQTAAEIADLNANEPKFREQADKMIADLSGKIDPAKLICLDLKEAKLDRETEFAVRTLEGLRLKISLVPGVCARLETKQQQTAHELNIALQKLGNEMEEVIREKIEALILELQPQINRICGGDRAKVNVVIKAIVDNSELSFWMKFWGLEHRHEKISHTARYISKHLERFQKGLCINSDLVFETVEK